jgi:hypothetical protein
MSGKPAQSQPYPGETDEMTPQPRGEMRDYAGRGLLEGKHALVTGETLGSAARWPSGSPRRAPTWRSRTWPKTPTPRIDVLVLHHGTQQPVKEVREITTDQLDRTLRVNVHSLFWDGAGDSGAHAG